MKVADKCLIALLFVVIAGFTAGMTMMQSQSPEPAFVVAPDTVKYRTIGKIGVYIRARNSRLPRTVVRDTAVAVYSVALLCAIIEKESIWEPTAVSKKNARGLMQVLCQDGVEINPSRVHDIEYNISVGAKIFLAKLHQENGNFYVALQKYSGNARGYADDVLRLMGRFMVFTTTFGDGNG